MDHAIVLAGGLGKRLWPISRKQYNTKESVNIASQTMLELTIDRLTEWVPKERIWVVSSKDIPTYGCRLIKEPFRKNTAAAISWGLSVINELDNEAFVGVFPVDHLISPFEKVVSKIEKIKERGSLTALAIVPSKEQASKQYGYLKVDIMSDGIGKVVDFIEKPESPLDYIYSGYHINSGIYIGPAKKFLAEIGRFLPRHFYAAKKRDIALFASLRPVSLDKGVMERTDRLYCCPLSVEWEDIGSWRNYLKHAGEKGNFVKYDSENSLIFAEEGLVVLSGINDAVVIVKDGVVLVMNKENEKEIASVVDEVSKLYPGYV